MSVDSTLLRKQTNTRVQLTADTRLLICARTSGWTVSLLISSVSIVEMDSDHREMISGCMQIFPINRRMPAIDL